MFKRIQEFREVPKGYWVIGYLWSWTKLESGKIDFHAIPDDPVVITNKDDCFSELTQWLIEEHLVDLFHLKREIFTYQFASRKLKQTTNKPKRKSKPKIKKAKGLTRTQRKKLPTIR